MHLEDQNWSKIRSLALAQSRTLHISEWRFCACIFAQPDYHSAFHEGTNVFAGGYLSVSQKPATNSHTNEAHP